MKKIDFENISINISILLYIIVCCIRVYVDNLIMSNLTIVLLLGAILLLMINMIKERKIKIVSKSYFILALLLLLPSFYKNAYINDHIYTYFLYYFLTIIYSIMFCFSNIKKNNIQFALLLFIIFAFATGIVTWISMFNPNFYVKKIIPLMPQNNQDELIKNFLYLKGRMGLTSHYSRNAFYLILGILGSIYFLFEEKKFKWKFSIFFLSITMLIIGKRGHFIFLVISLLLSYFIFFRINVKTIAKLFFCICIIGAILFFSAKIQPEINNTFKRFYENENSDISNGRFEMYSDAWNMFKNSGYIGIGWNGYASNTNYLHPGVHNDYIQILCESGIIGFILVIGSNLYILRKSRYYARKKQNSLSFIILTYNIFFLCYSLTGLPHFDVETYMYYFLINCILFNIDDSNIQFEKVLKPNKQNKEIEA